MSEIEVAGSLIPGTTNTPLDARTRKDTLAEMLTIENPAVGMHVYVTETGKEYVVKTLKSKTIGTIETADAQIDTYEEVPAKADLDAKATTAAVETVAGAVASLQTAVAGKADAEDLEALAATVATKVEDFSFTVSESTETGAVTASYTPAGGSATSLTVSEDKQTITIPLSVLGISGLYTYDLYNADGRLMSNTAELDYQITSEALVLKFAGGWTAGDWKLKGGTGGASGAKGDPGDIGPQGTLTEAVSYDSETAYAYLALVTYGGSTYQCIASAGSTVGDLPTDTSKFKLIAQKGEPGESGSTYAGWTALSYAASLSLSRSESLAENQKVTLTGNITLTAPELSETYPLLLLQITTAGYTVFLGSDTLISTSDSTYLVGWFWDGAQTRRMAVMEAL